MKRGIYLVANRQSQKMCENLIYSIRQSGCSLPIRLIHFGGKEINSRLIKDNVELIYHKNFPDTAQQFIANLRTVLTDCPLGFLYRFVGWFLDWDEFIYSDNDIVALSNWDKLFEYLPGYDLLHADEEYTTKGIYNYVKPKAVQKIFGEEALESAMTAGHIVVKKNGTMVSDFNRAISWFKENPDIPQKHDQTLLHIASLLGNWRTINLCKPPYNWLSSWAGDYKNTLGIIQRIQMNNSKISHIHYSGGTPSGILAIHDLLFGCTDDKKRILRLTLSGIRLFSGLDKVNVIFGKVMQKIRASI